MYHEFLNEVNKVKSEYEAKLIQAVDNFAVMKTENEVLKERVDVLFKLGRSYLSNPNNPKSANEKDAIEKPSNNDVQVIEETVEVIDDLETLQAWSRNKLRGFKRVDPSTVSVPHPAPTSTSTAAPTRATNGVPNPTGPHVTAPAPKVSSVTSSIISPSTFSLGHILWLFPCAFYGIYFYLGHQGHGTSFFSSQFGLL